jgi:DNA-3-methyladenine glycosylase II
MGKCRPTRWADAMAHLEALDERWASRIARLGPCELTPRRDRFAILVRAVVGQCISTAAARTIYQRLLERGGSDLDGPEPLVSLGVDGIRQVGLSRSKAQTIYDLATAAQSGVIPLSRIGRLSDDEIIKCLTQVRGIGRWTAEMFLVFALNRPDVMAVDDLGIRMGIRDHFGLDALPKPSRCAAMAEPWRPYRTVAMWYLWRELDVARSR